MAWKNSPLDGVAREDLAITDLKVKALSYRLTEDEQWPDAGQHFIIWKTSTVIVELHTDAGLVGIGGASRYAGPAVMKPYAENVIKPWLVGRNPFDVETLAAGKCQRGERAIWAAIDVAMWDLIGQAKGLPVYKLLAVDCEPNPAVPVYASGGEFSWHRGSRWDQPESLIEKALAHKEAGYKAYKFRPGAGFEEDPDRMREHIPLIRKVREAVGGDFDLIQESNCRWTMNQCREIAPVLDELGFLWWEEPYRKWDKDSVAKYKEIKSWTNVVKISGAETLENRGLLAPWLDHEAYDIVQMGADDAGLTEAWWMARQAATHGIQVCPHNWQGGMVTAANAHLMAAIPNALLLESNMTANPLKEGLFNEDLVAKDGIIQLSDCPGLGVTLRDDLEERFPYVEGPWHLSEDDL